MWIDIEACRSFWQEFDTYRVGVTKQSESTMHTLSKRRPTAADFETNTHHAIITAFQFVWDDHRDDIMVLKESMPEGFLQRRIVCTNYKAIRNIVTQRKKHRFKWWGVLEDALREQLANPELIWGLEK
ncbi:MAG: hypothetical protein IBX56_12410 [Methylomicrobium sp.]|nr:hypothetical protein [Methylomicrobium sp.]